MPMSEVKSIKEKCLMPEVKKLLDAGIRVRITVTGMSMYPFLRGGKDKVELINTVYEEVKQGDILLVIRENGQYVLHRMLVKGKRRFYLNGDAQQWWEGPLYPNQIIARVRTIWRQDRCISCEDKRFRYLSQMWFFLLPFRYILIRVYCFRRVIRKVIRGR